jgi:EAL domain-containing protein (putative c-di-GMP-specific phosphodiesterase class I)
VGGETETVRLVVMGSDDYVSDRFPTLSFAQKDCLDIKDFFRSPEGVVTHSSNAHELVGEAFTTEAAKEKLLQVARDTDENDLLIVFFAGHGHLSEGENDPILVTHDLDPKRVERLGDEGLRMSFLQQYVFERCAGHSLLFMDSCYAGNYAQVASNRERFLGAAMVNSGGRIGRHTAFLSCRAGELSFEETGLGNGRFTSRLLNGLRGEARGRDSLVVTANFLFPYLQTVSADQPPELGGANAGALVLSRPRMVETLGTIDEDKTRAIVAPSWAVKAMANPLDGCVGLVDEILSCIPATFTPGISAAQEVAQRLFGRTARLETFSAHTSDIAARSSSAVGAELAALSQQFVRGGWRSANGWSVTPAGGARRLGNNKLSVVTRRYSGRGAFDALVVKEDLPERWSNDAAAVVLAGALDGLVNPDATCQSIAGDAADALRTAYGRVPDAMYQQRFDSFRSVLSEQMIYFQPILKLAQIPEGVGIDGWEALARDPRTGSAPEALFQAAELWGTRFIVELDLTLARKGIEGYLEAHRRVVDLSRAEGIKPVSVNVYPESLLSNSYLDGLADVLRSTGLPPGELVLEISEKRPLPRPPYVARSESATRAFGRVLEEIVRSHRVSFAIDDFGVGHASLDRLSKLHLAHVKIDRAVLMNSSAIQAIALVVDITRRLTSSASKIVIEGYDEAAAARISLRQLYEDAKVLHLQGHLVEMPRPELHGLNGRLREVIAGLVRGDDNYDLADLVAVER